MGTNKINYRSRVILYFFIVVLIVVIMVSTLVYFNVKVVMESETRDTNLNTVTQLKNATEMMLNEVNNSLTQVALDSSILTFANTYENSNYRYTSSIMERLGSIMSSNNYVTSCFILYFEQRKVLDAMRSQFLNLDASADRELINDVWAKYLKENLSDPFIIYNVKTSGGSYILTAVKPLGYSPLNQQGLLIVTMGQDYFKDMMDSIKINDKADVYIIDQAGEIISRKNNNSFLFIDKLAAGDKSRIIKDKSGSFITKIDGRSYLLSSVTSEKFGWKFLYSIPTGEIYKKVDFVGEYVLGISVLCLLLGIAGSVFFAGRLYSPISRMVKDIRKCNNAWEKRKEDDIAFIDRSVKELISHNQTLEESFKESMPVLKNSLLNGLMRNVTVSDEPIWQKLLFYKVNLTEKGFYCTCIIEIDQFETLVRDYSQKQISMLEVYQMEIINDICREEQDIGAEIIKMDTNETAILINISCTDRDESGLRILNIISKIHNEITRNMKFTVTIGIGSLYDDINNISRSYREAQSALGYKVIKGTNRIISIRDIPQVNNWRYVYPYDMENEILTGLRHGDEDRIYNSLKAYCEYAQNNMTESSEMKFAFLRMLDATVRCILEMSIDVNEIFHAQSDMYSELLSQVTIEDVQHWFKSLYQRIICFINTKKENRIDEIVQKTKEYIDNQYKSPDISIDTISAQLHFSASYLGKLFRDHNGMSIKEYITERRIEDARRYLEMTEMKVKEIGEQVGYVNDRSFIHIFKKYLGETPGEYRDRRLKKII